MAGVVLSSQKVLPEKVTANNYTFKFTNLADAFNSLFNWKESCHDRLFEQQQWTHKPLNEVFDFFSDVKNLEELTPPLLNFKVKGKSTENIQEGTKIYYKLKIRGIPASWTSLITNWQPMSQFADVQLKDLTLSGTIVILFRNLAGGVLLEDKIVYRLPFSRYGGNLLNWFIRKDIKTIFSYRRNRIKEWH
jgi:ligand-binding SRPBCC domain-containing protein